MQPDNQPTQPAQPHEITIAVCDVCRNWIPVHELRRNARYDIMVCPICHDTNAAGWAPVYEHAVTRKLRARACDIPARNEHGLLPRE